MAKPKIDPLIDRRRLLDEFDVITEDDLAVVLDVVPKTLKNRPRSKLPKFSRVGRERLFHKDDVKAFLKANVPDPTTTFRVNKPKPRRRPRRAADDRLAT
jgi:hypothetical protein